MPGNNKNNSQVGGLAVKKQIVETTKIGDDQAMVRVWDKKEGVRLYYYFHIEKFRHLTFMKGGRNFDGSY